MTFIELLSVEALFFEKDHLKGFLYITDNQQYRWF